MMFPWNLDPEDFTSGWEGEQEFTDPEHGLQFRPVPPPPPVERPTTPLPSAAQDQLTQADFMDMLDATDQETTDVPSLDYLDMSLFEGDVLSDAPGGMKFMDTLHGKKRAASDAVLFEDQSECSNPKKKRRVSHHQTTANKNTAAVSCAVPASSDTSATSRRQQEDKPYIKKPPKVVQELQITDCAKVNVVLGQRWSMLSEQEQASYYEQAHRERRAHKAKYPGWSTKDNFGRKAKKSQTNGLPVVTNHQQFALPVAPAYQQPVISSNTTQPMSFTTQALPNQALYTRPVPPSPLTPVAPPNVPFHTDVQDLRTQGFKDFVVGGAWKKTVAELTSWVEAQLADSGSLPNDEVLSPGSPVMPREPFDKNGLFDTPEESEWSSQKRKKVSHHQTTANHNAAGPSFEPRSTPNGNPVIHSNALISLGTFQGKQLYTYAALASDPSAMSRGQQEDKPYIKKPPNAFMLFRTEQRPKVVQELQITDCAKVNVVLGQRWRMLSEQEQAPYFEQAHRERRAHEAKYPGWSTKDNFARKRKMKNNDLPNLTNYQQLPVPVASSSQQPVLWSRLINQAHGNQALPN